jgi:hypothetical protein
MIGLEASLEAPATARYHREAIEQIVQCVEERVYCALLGPRLCGKTQLLRYIEERLANLLGWTCVYINLEDLRNTTQQVFFADLTRLTASRLEDLTGKSLLIPDEQEASSAVFRGFLLDCVENLQRDVVLLFDPLEALPTDLVQALLTSLRAAYMDQQNLDYQVTLVISGALSLANLTVGESSPFRGIARRVFVGDLSAEASLALIQEFLDEQRVRASRSALQTLLDATRGDTFLIRRISQLCARVANSRPHVKLRVRDIRTIINRFLRDEVFHYAPLLEAIRLIEEDPDLLHCILILLEQEPVHRAELPLPLSPDLDPLYLTGVVEHANQDEYRLQNQIYRQFLAQHFVPGRVGHLLAMAGRWDSAIDYLEKANSQQDASARLEILPATLNSIFAAQDLTQAVYFLRRGLAAVFGVQQALFWYMPPHENFLRLIGLADANLEDGLLPQHQIPVSADRLEARAYRQQVLLRGQENAGRVTRAIPLRIPGHKPVGVITIYDALDDEQFGDLRERDLQLVGFLNQAARALQAVGVRRQELTMAGRIQANLLPKELPDLPGWQVTATWRPARETSGDFYDFISLPGERLGIVIADVVDKGMGAALMMALCRTLLRTFAAEYPDQPQQVLKMTNQRLIADVESGPFITLFYGVFTPSTGRLVYSNAGHPPPFFFTPQNQPPVPLNRTGMPLGIEENPGWEYAELVLDPGDLLLIYTDGIIEAQNESGEFYGQERMLKTVQANQTHSIQEIQDMLIGNEFAFSGSERQQDDITLILLRRDG